MEWKGSSSRQLQAAGWKGPRGKPPTGATRWSAQGNKRCMAHIRPPPLTSSSLPNPNPGLPTQPLYQDTRKPWVASPFQCQSVQHHSFSVPSLYSPCHRCAGDKGRPRLSLMLFLRFLLLFHYTYVHLCDASFFPPRITDQTGKCAVSPGVS